MHPVVAPDSRAKTWDVVILDATGCLGAEGHPLRDALVRRGLRVKLNIIPEGRARSTPDEIFDAASARAYCVHLMTVPEEASDRRGSSREVTSYLGCLEPDQARRLRLAELTVEDGTLPQDRQRLVDQIVAYLRPNAR